jgi:hypothetical protein
MPNQKTKTNSSEKSGEIELTVLMPCMNEAETLGICIAKAQAYLVSR